MSSFCFAPGPHSSANSLCRHTGLGHRANDGALRRVRISFALGALGRIDHIYVVLQANRSVGTFELTRTADGALGRDYLVGHHCGSISRRCGTASCLQVSCQSVWADLPRLSSRAHVAASTACRKLYIRNHSGLISVPWRARSMTAVSQPRELRPPALWRDPSHGRGHAAAIGSPLPECSAARSAGPHVIGSAHRNGGGFD